MSNLESNALRILGIMDAGGQAETSGLTVQMIRQGFQVQSALRVARFYDASDKELSVMLGTSERTLSRRKQESSLLPGESDRLYRLAYVAARAQEVFESDETARKWLRRPNRALGGTIPFDLLDTEPGAQQVMEVLDRIDYGVYS